MIPLSRTPFAKILYKSSEIPYTLEDFSYTYSDDTPDEAELTLKTSDETIVDHPALQENTEIVVQWGYLAGDMMSRLVLVQDLSTVFDKSGVTVKIKCNDKGILLHQSSSVAVYNTANLAYLMDFKASKFNLNALIEYSSEAELLDILNSLKLYDSIPQANKTDMELLQEMLHAEHPELIIVTRDDRIILRKRDLKQTPLRTYTYKESVGRLLSFTPEVKVRETALSSININVHNWDDENKTVHAQTLNTNSSQVNFTLSKSVTLTAQEKATVKASIYTALGQKFIYYDGFSSKRLDTDETLGKTTTAKLNANLYATPLDKFGLNLDFINFIIDGNSNLSLEAREALVAREVDKQVKRLVVTTGNPTKFQVNGDVNGTLTSGFGNVGGPIGGGNSSSVISQHSGLVELPNDELDKRLMLIHDSFNRAEFGENKDPNFIQPSGIFPNRVHITHPETEAAIDKTNTNIFYKFQKNPSAYNDYLTKPVMYDFNAGANSVHTEPERAANEANRMNNNANLHRNPAIALVIGDPFIQDNQVFGFLGVGVKYSGNYWGKKSIHKVNKKQGYTTSIELRRDGQNIKGLTNTQLSRKADKIINTALSKNRESGKSLKHKGNPH